MSVAPSIPRHDPHLEEHLLKCVLVKPELYDTISVQLSTDSFYLQKHKTLWEAFADLRKAGREIDLVTVMDQLTHAEKLGSFGGAAGLAEMLDVVSTSNWSSTMDSLLEYQRRRSVQAMAQKLLHAANDLSSPVNESAPALLKDMAEALVDRSRTDQQSPSGFIQEWLDRLERLSNMQGHVLKTPFYGLNGLASGFFPGEVIVLAGRPGGGKTAFALNVSEYALKKKRKVGIFSLEMSKYSLLDRIAASGKLAGRAQGLDAQRFRDGKFEEQDWSYLYEIADIMAQDIHLRIWDRASARPSEIRAQAAAWKQEMGGLDLLVIDYLQLTSPDSRGSSREREVGEVSRSVKTMALELDVPVLLLSQLSREAERTKKPLLSHLRESGSIEQDADMVIFLTPQRSDETEDGYEVAVDVAKGRGNRTGSFNLMYRRKHLQFANLELDQYQPGGGNP
jgi:replicative DNA helicase